MSSGSDSKPDSKRCIIQAATTLFAKLGLDKCSTREIAKQSDSNISLISYYFGGKEGLYKEVMRSHGLEIKEKTNQIVERMQNADMSREMFIENVGLTVETIIQTRLQNPDMAKIFSREKLAGLPFAKEVHEEIFYPLILNFYQLIYAGQKKGYVKPDVNPALFFVIMTEGIWGFYEMMDCNTQLSRDCSELLRDPDKLKQQILNIYLTGVLE